ncbi:apolipoprotein N-acyltransferase [Ahrensia kielensis]|uniref:apolipoprotein N-acyltransferase n=1 Tax=Ahrensia kielensis TaxID=76980 RepID=UPI00037A2143|nr:apolipoprotein N-acyltransferase [Ahrensia kielensis]
MQRLSQKILLLSGWKRALIAFMIGALTALALAPFHFFFIGFLTFPILVWLLDGAVGRIEAGRIARHFPAFWTGWFFGFGYFVAGLWWISNALLVEAPEFAWAIPLAVLGLPALLAIFYGAATVLARSFWSSSVARIFVLAASFGVAEWLRTFVLTGFPWNALSNTIQPSPLMMQSSAFVGADAMNVLAVACFALPAAFFTKGRERILALICFMILLGGHLGIGVWRLNYSPEPDAEGSIVRIVQPAVDQSTKLEPGDGKEVFAALLELSSQPIVDETLARPRYIIWPETSVPFILTREPQAVAAIADMLKVGQSLIAGVVREEVDEDSDGSQRRYYNSMLLINDEGIITSAADKTHLVPFGEYLPFSEQLKQWGFKAVAAADRGYFSGAQRRSLPISTGLTAIPLICYEVIFGSEINHLEKTDGLMINVTNDAWYGHTPGPYQHFHQSQLRAVEMGMPMVRAANNGISGFIDAKGRIKAKLEYGQTGAIDAELPASLAIPFGKQFQSQIFWLLVVLFATIGIVSRTRG